MLTGLAKLTTCLLSASAAYMYSLGWRRDKINIAFELDGVLVQWLGRYQVISRQRSYHTDPFIHYSFARELWAVPRPGYWLLPYLGKIANLHLYTTSSESEADELVGRMYPVDPFLTRRYNASSPKSVEAIPGPRRVLVDRQRSPDTYTINPTISPRDLELFEFALWLVKFHARGDIAAVNRWFRDRF